MPRKNPFESVLGDAPAPSSKPVPEFAARGASKSITSTLDDLADKADKLLEGETIVEIDPALIDPSFIRDRLDHDTEEFEALKSAIEQEGQSSPILVRPHPSNDKRYMVVFGARRRRAAEELGIKVRAVVKDLTDRDHAVAQGQENAARANLSFIEKALMASELAKQNYDQDNATVLSALAIDKATLSKMLAVAGIDERVLNQLGSARATGRDRWYELKGLLDRPANTKKALETVKTDAFLKLEGDRRFDHLLTLLKKSNLPRKGAVAKAQAWIPQDRRVEVQSSKRGKNYTIAVKAKDHSGIEFGEFVSKRLEELYEQFKAETKP
ncbi:plasmid partitioning protein RepB [Litoreibacter roseus]|uniref:Putative replication protein B n=1 Tax=Litoreibacter roseus TaxID=2601869 RepID=A0A6N6JLM2_9RHOB|nr:plasmid partitioning protein RepB [Litoreibacter roseus]GFE66975.1 putative replication protein B [Litoreibacter roseus]